MKKKILIDMQKLSNLESGLGQFCNHLGYSLVEQNDEYELWFWVPKEVEDIYGENLNYIVGKPRSRFIKSVDLFHATHQECEIPRGVKRTLLTIHDLNFLYKEISPVKKLFRKWKLGKLISKATGINAISNYTAKDVTSNYLVKNPVTVIHNGTPDITSIFQNPVMALVERTFVFSIGIFTEKKNFHSLLPLLKLMPDVTLAIAGDHNTSYGANLLGLAKRLGVESQLILTGKVSESQKAWLYQNCKAFVFPSISEGFGLPVVEAMQFGKPIFLSNKTSLPEIGGDAAFYWNDFDPQTMKEVYEKGLSVFNDELQKKIKHRAEMFKWSSTARQYLELYKSLLA